MSSISVTAEGAVDPASLEASVDADIETFDRWFQKELKNDPLLKSERALLKTYLYWKTHQEQPNGA